MNLIKSFTFFLCLFVISSCSEKYKSFYEKNQKSFQELTESINQNNLIGEACCVGDNCFDHATENLMTSLNFECVRRDTVEKTLNFTCNSSKLKAIEFVYQYKNDEGEPKSYPKAGEEIERLSERWFVRKIYFD